MMESLWLLCKGLRERNQSIPLQKVLKSQRKTARVEERNKEITKQSENNEQNGNCKSTSLNNYFKHKWTKFSNQKK